MSNKGQMLQDPFLNTLRKEHVQVSIYLVNGIKLQGQIESFDQYVVLLKNTVTQMVYKHAISTVVPARAGRDAAPRASRRPAKPDRRALPGRAEPPARRPARDAGAAVRARRSRMFERPTGGDRALLVALDFGDGDPVERLAELDALATSAGATVVGTRHRPPPAPRRRALRRQGQGRGDRRAARGNATPTS